MQIVESHLRYVSFQESNATDTEKTYFLSVETKMRDDADVLIVVFFKLGN